MVMSSVEACTVISCECFVLLDICLEWDTDESVESESSGAASLSDWPELSSRCSSGVVSAGKICDGLVVNGRMHDHGGDSRTRSCISGSDVCAFHSFNLFATQGFCVHRSFEKYALHACVFDSG
jgi:hypothetical protein